MTITQTNPFDHFLSQAWPYKFKVTLAVNNLAGGVPSDPRVAEGWLRTKLAHPDDLIRQEVALTMTERGISVDQATQEVNSTRHLNGFKRTEDGFLYIEGRQLKAAIKEAASVAGAAGKIPLKQYGRTNKGLLGFLAEHVVVDEDTLVLHDADGNPVKEPDEIIQRFVHTFRGNGIQYEEVVHSGYVTATILSDWDFVPKFWPMVWLTGQKQGIGSSRSQGMGTYVVTEWETLGRKSKATDDPEDS